MISIISDSVQKKLMRNSNKVNTSIFLELLVIDASRIIGD